jgi:hypothetical protein
LSFPGDNELFVNLSEDSISDYLKTNRNSDKTKTNAYSIGVKGGKPGMNQLRTIRINSDEKGKLTRIIHSSINSWNYFFLKSRIGRTLEFYSCRSYISHQ